MLRFREAANSFGIDTGVNHGHEKTGSGQQIQGRAWAADHSADKADHNDSAEKCQDLRPVEAF
jgi:hypothetical protein